MFSKDFRLASVHVVAFTPDASAFKTSSVLTPILMKSRQRYDGEVKTPQAVAIEAHGVKRAISTVEISSDDGQWKITATPERVDSLWQFLPDVDGSKKLAQRGVGYLSNACAQPVLHYLEDSGVQVGRLSMLVRRWQAVAHPAQKLAETFCKDELSREADSSAPLRHSKEFQLHNLKNFVLAKSGVEVNSWVRCTSGAYVNNLAVRVEQDINTRHEDLRNKAFTKDEVIQFYQEVSVEADSILNLYFPSVNH